MTCFKWMKIAHTTTPPGSSGDPFLLFEPETIFTARKDIKILWLNKQQK
ncbi:MAG: hypothetical protein ACI9V8_002276 [Urechidicola sp.]|jgi:hypothetical protein